MDWYPSTLQNVRHHQIVNLDDRKILHKAEDTTYLITESKYLKNLLLVSDHSISHLCTHVENALNVQT